jgi:hypothetical protein
LHHCPPKYHTAFSSLLFLISSSVQGNQSQDEWQRNSDQSGNGNGDLFFVRHFVRVSERRPKKMKKKKKKEKKMDALLGPFAPLKNS